MAVKLQGDKPLCGEVCKSPKKKSEKNLLVKYNFYLIPKYSYSTFSSMYIRMVNNGY